MLTWCKKLIFWSRSDCSIETVWSGYIKLSQIHQQMAKQTTEKASMTRNCHKHRPPHGTVRKRHRTLTVTWICEYGIIQLLGQCMAAWYAMSQPFVPYRTESAPYLHKRDATGPFCVGGSWLGDGIWLSLQLLKWMMELIWFEIIKKSNIWISHNIHLNPWMLQFYWHIWVKPRSLDKH